MNLVCPIRKKKVAATPEELVRASFLTFLFQKGFPASLIIVEAALKDLPHIKDKILLDRRVDILCYNHQFEPLLLIECKENFHPSHFGQLISYNHLVKASYVALVSKDRVEIKTKDGETTLFKEFPTFLDLNPL
jgi:hypothetical protein